MKVWDVAAWQDDTWNWDAWADALEKLFRRYGLLLGVY